MAKMPYKRNDMSRVTTEIWSTGQLYCNIELWRLTMADYTIARTNGLI